MCCQLTLHIQVRHRCQRETHQVRRQLTTCAKVMDPIMVTRNMKTVKTFNKRCCNMSHQHPRRVFTWTLELFSRSFNRSVTTVNWTTKNIFYFSPKILCNGLTPVANIMQTPTILDKWGTAHRLQILCMPTHVMEKQLAFFTRQAACWAEALVRKPLNFHSGIFVVTHWLRSLRWASQPQINVTNELSITATMWCRESSWGLKKKCFGIQGGDEIPVSY